MTNARSSRILAGVLVVAGVILWATALPEVFTVDDCNYFANVHAFRHGGVTVPGTDALVPSRELVGFDPVAPLRALEAGRVTSNAPPLYGVLALPFSYLGFRGLVAINTLAFMIAAWLVFRMTAKHAKDASTAWLALGIFMLGGFSLDYAQGVWPHMLSVALCLGAVTLAVEAAERDDLRRAGLAGLCMGLAVGVRYQNAAFAAAAGIGVLAFSPRRLRHGLSFGLGAAGPVLACSLINHARLGTYNPISKGSWYLDKPKATESLGAGEQVADALGALWARVVDYSSHPPFASGWLRNSLPKDPDTGVFLVVGGLKKALLQSAPWIAVALLAVMLVWTRRSHLGEAAQRFVRRASLPIFTMLAVFAWAGLERGDGWCFNQRYLLELVPLFAIITALSVEPLDLRRHAQLAVIVGAVTSGVAAVAVVAIIPEHALRQRMLMWGPLVVTAVLAVGFGVAVSKGKGSRIVAGALAASVAWALVVHIGDDMVAARGLRDWNRFQRNVAKNNLPDGATALISVSPQKEAMCPFHLERDIVLVDPGADGGADLDVLTGQLLAEKRRVFVMGGLSQAHLAAVFRGRGMRMVANRPMPFAEVVAAGAPAPRRAPVERVPTGSATTQ